MERLSPNLKIPAIPMQWAIKCFLIGGQKFPSNMLEYQSQAHYRAHITLLGIILYYCVNYCTARIIELYIRAPKKYGYFRTLGVFVSDTCRFPTH
jgi:hypothetical protein